MTYYEVVPLKIVHGSQGVLTYHSEQLLQVGMIVSVPVGKTSSVSAVILCPVSKPLFATRSITSVIETTGLPTPLIQLASWISEFYVTHPVTVWQSILPRGLSKKRRVIKKDVTYPIRKRTNIVLNNDQSTAVEKILHGSAGTFLLHGVTGSGKTQVYIELAKNTISAGRSVIILVPEIALTSQLIAEFKPHFPDSIVTHSTMTESERHLTWQKILRATTPQVVIGPRSALFSPICNLGLIVIDECHEPTYKQEQSPRYSALRAAAMLARYANAHLVMGSATPSISDYYLAQQSKRPIIMLPTPARPGTIKPCVSVIDLTKKHSFSRHRLFSNKLLSAIEASLSSHNQSLLFHNRRGTAPLTVCEQCGWSAICQRCFIPLTLHADHFKLQCHICGGSISVPTNCPECHGADIIHKGIGTKLIHQEIAKLFPDARIARFDGDTDASETFEKMYQSVYDGEIDIIIGTQVIAKGIDLPLLRTVGVIQADAGLAMPDYLSAERTFQLLAQVSGRVGRNEYPSQFIVQSYQPQHIAITNGITNNYAEFYKAVIEERKRAHFPPFRHLLKLVCIYKTEATAIRNAQVFARNLRQSTPSRVEILGPTPAFYERIRETYRWQLIVKSTARKDLVNIIKLLPSAHWHYELDPGSLL